MYTTALKLTEQFGYSRIAKYSTPVGRQPVVTAKLLEALLIGGSTSSFTSDQIAMGNLAVAKINDAIKSGEAVVNSYLIKKYSIPLSDSLLFSNREALLIYTNNIIRYDLAPHKNIEPITDKYNEAISWLDDVSKNGLPFDTSTETPIVGINRTLSIKSTGSSIPWEKF